MSWLGHYSNHFPQPASHISRGGFLDMSCQSRDRLPLITGFSSIRTWVTQPRHQLQCLGNKRFYQASGEAHSFYRPYKGTRTPLFRPRLLLPDPFPFARAPAPEHSSSPTTKAFRKCPDPEQEANGWPLPSGRRISKSFGRPGIWPRKSAIVSRRRDRSSNPGTP